MTKRALTRMCGAPRESKKLRWIFRTPRTNRRNLGGYFALPVLGGPGGVSPIKQVRELLIRGDSSSTPGKNDHSSMPKFIKQVRELLIRGNSSSMPCKLITHLHRIRATVDHPVRGSLRTL
ncbi:unnamed protein product [Sphagnum jensenii]